MACKLGVAIYVVLQLIAFVAVMVGTGVDMFYNKPEHSSGARVFAIISILVYGAAFVLGLVLLYGCTIHRWVCLALNIVGAVTLFIVWVAIVVTYNKDDGQKCPKVRDTGYRLGTGFALLVAAWILDILNIIFLLLPCTVPATKANEKPESPTAQE